MSPRPSRRHRGAALIMTMIAIAVLLVLVVGAIQFTGVNRQAAGSKVAGDRLHACTQVARQYVMSRLQLFGVPVTSLEPLDETIPDAVNAADRTRVMNAHYDQTTAQPTVVAVEATGFGSSVSGVREAANTIARSGSFGQYYRVVAKCREPDGKELETEFLFRYGL